MRKIKKSSNNYHFTAYVAKACLRNVLCKTKVFRGIHYFLTFALKHRFVSTPSNRPIG